MRILIIEDEVRLAGTLADLLRRQGYAADTCHDGLTGLDNAAGGIYDLVILDAMLPGLDGFSLLQQLRAGGSAVPVLMLTARSDSADKVRGLDSGADYYLTKPFDAQELHCAARSVRLSRKEYDMMELLMRNQKVIVTKERLLLKVWGYDTEAEDNNVEVYISFLRRKLTHLHSAVKIKTVRMVGYCLEVEE